ncbi:MAG: isochorismatase family protein, partial [Streptosporangiaceae bacterium]
FETGLQAELAARGIGHLVIAGAMTEYCIDTNCRRATSQGYDVTLAADAHITSDNKILMAEQIVAHHNKLLAGFGSGSHRVTVMPAAAIA